MARLTHWPRALFGLGLFVRKMALFRELVMALFRRATVGSNGHRDGELDGTLLRLIVSQISDAAHVQS